jgi:hypothetical protein
MFSGEVTNVLTAAKRGFPTSSATSSFWVSMVLTMVLRVDF